MESIKKIINYSHYKKVKDHHDLLIQLVDKNGTSQELGLAFVGISYEYLIMGLYKEVEKTTYFIEPRIFNSSLIKSMKEDDNLLVVIFVLLDYIKNEPKYKENFFFKIFMQELESNQIPLPQNDYLNIKIFLKAYYNIYKSFQISIKI